MLCQWESITGIFGIVGGVCLYAENGAKLLMGTW